MIYKYPFQVLKNNPLNIKDKVKKNIKKKIWITVSIHCTCKIYSKFYKIYKQEEDAFNRCNLLLYDPSQILQKSSSGT